MKHAIRMLSMIAAAAAAASAAFAPSAVADTVRLSGSPAVIAAATAATESMKEQAASLLRVVSRFDLGNDAPADARQPGQPAIARRSVVLAPIRVRPAAQREPFYPAAATSAAAGHGAGNGEWKEF